MPHTCHGSNPPAPESQWMEIASAPFDRELELAVIGQQGIHRLVFPCRRILGGWMNSINDDRIPDLEPTHWRAWRRPD